MRNVLDVTITQLRTKRLTQKNFQYVSIVNGVVSTQLIRDETVITVSLFRELEPKIFLVLL